MELEKLNDKVQKIQEDLRKVKETVISDAKRKEKIEEIKRRAEETKKELEKNINTLKDKAKDEAKTILNSLNEIINFKLSIWNAASWNTSWGTVSSNWNIEQWFLIKRRIGFEINGQISGMKKNGKRSDEKMLYVLHDL